MIDALTPNTFMKLTQRLQPWLFLMTILLNFIGLYWALFIAPSDYQQGDAARIMYVHVPAAWMAMGGYAFIALCSAVGLIWRLPMADITAKAAAPIGACFTLICLVTGAIWGKPMWGTWWVWDARLTSVLILLFLYLGYITIVDAFDNSLRGARAGALLAIVGIINLPIIKWSVEWWNTLHQPASIMKLSSPSIHPSMLVPLFIVTAGFVCYFMTVLAMRIESELLARKIIVLRSKMLDMK
jgi:heme exporter protein C